MNICVYGASSDRIDPAYRAVGEALGRMIAERGYGLVFGGGGTGMMGAAARGAYAAGGKITGVTPRFFNVDGVLFEHCDPLIYTETMRERKQTMEDLSDAFIMTPGGIGTYEEFFEILTTRQLGRHGKPIVALNINGYFDPLLAMINKNVEQGFINGRVHRLFFVCNDPDEALRFIECVGTVTVDPKEFRFADK